MTLDQARTDARTILNDLHGAVYPDVALNAWLSQGQQVAAALTLCVQTRVVFASTDSPQAWVAGLREYPLAGVVGAGGFGLPTALKALAVALNGNYLPLWTAEMLSTADARSDEGGQPRFWYQFGQRIGFIPYPTTAFVATSWTLEVIVADVPVDWTAGDSALPANFDALPTYFAVLRGLLSRRYWTRAAQAYRTWWQLLLRCRAVSLTPWATSREALRQPVAAPRLDRPPPPQRRRA